MDRSLQNWIVFALLLETVLLVVGLRRAYRAGALIAWSSSAALGVVWFSGIRRYPFVDVGTVDIVFLSLAFITLALAALLLLRGGRSATLYWTVWLFNLLLSTAVIVLALGFRLRF